MIKVYNEKILNFWLPILASTLFLIIDKQAITSLLLHLSYNHRKGS